jgi:hypothetical protein
MTGQLKATWLPCPWLWLDAMMCYNWISSYLVVLIWGSFPKIYIYPYKIRIANKKHIAKQESFNQYAFYVMIIWPTSWSYIKLCSHEVANHKSGVICRFHLTVPVRMGNAHAGSLRTRRRQYTNPMSKLISPKTFQSNKSAKIFKILVKLCLII